MPRWKVVVETRSPNNPTAETWKVGIDEGLLKAIQGNAHEQKFARLALVDEVLKNTTAIIRGWDRADKASCLVYVGQPKHDFQKVSIELPPKPGMVFLVFILPDGTIDDWGWRAIDNDHPGLPENVNGEVIWTTA